MIGSKQYFAVLLLFLISILFAALPLIGNKIINFLLNKNNPNKKIVDHSYNTQSSAYECGIKPLIDARSKFPIKFALIAILFIIFDLEVAFFFPWAVIFSKLTSEAKLAMGIFFLILVIGFIYEWKKGALEWE